MAPFDRMTHEEFERTHRPPTTPLPIPRAQTDTPVEQLKDVIQDFYQIMVQVSTYDTTGRPSRDVLSNEVTQANPSVTSRKTLSRSLQALHASASSPHGSALPSVPPELLESVENGRNPDIYTREFVELVRRGNQLMRGKVRAFDAFRDVLAEQMAQAMPELRGDVERVLEATAGRPLGPSSSAEEGNGNTAAGAGARDTGAEAAPMAGG
ncbi:Mediator of RNA polymerase II transcription subunit 10 [Tolypocladium ophioglossoides CBS 100239]|uniref:Mediator of RNA polymerase II transcription subunit 10 n=1 Tax=Tolypocladium ophioglossoides (strain CBS 100239) TaxID=1163406 RepID=A0A0L0N2B7_TOLOC|nr:Mediator of RNA polymerase II transcription subunit 10 [Tolypocladium ophioglossoides CBS 100239]